MAAALVLPTSGPYTCNFNALAMGTQDDNGFELQCTIHGQEVNASDAYGMTLVEGIYRGNSWKCRLRGLEWDKTGLLTALQMFGQTGAARSLTPSLGVIGDRMSRNAKTLLLTAILGDPPCIPQTLTALTATITPNSQSAFNLTSKMREFPLEFALLPYASGSGNTTIPFSTT